MLQRFYLELISQPDAIHLFRFTMEGEILPRERKLLDAAVAQNAREEDIYAALTLFLARAGLGMCSRSRQRRFQFAASIMVMSIVAQLADSRPKLAKCTGQGPKFWKQDTEFLENVGVGFRFYCGHTKG